MNGLEFARCTTAGGFDRVLIHAAPGKAKIEVIAYDDQVVARADLDRAGEYSPMTLVELDGPELRRSEVWPTDELYGLPVLLAGGEVGILQEWHHAEDHSWWQWSLEFSNHRGRPADWAPPRPARPPRFLTAEGGGRAVPLSDHPGMLVGRSIPRDPMEREHHERPDGRGRWPSDSSW